MEEKKKDVVKEDESVTIALPQPDLEKKVLITTDGKNIKIATNNINSLELEMMLIKSLDSIKGKEV